MKKLNLGLCHASAVALDDQGVLFIGPSGSGKSQAAFTCLTLGAKLIGDDQVELRASDDVILLMQPPHIAGMIELRGVGILAAPTQSQARLALVVDLNRQASTRLPEPKFVLINQHQIPILAGAKLPNLAATIRHILTYGFHPTTPN